MHATHILLRSTITTLYLEKKQPHTQLVVPSLRAKIVYSYNKTADNANPQVNTAVVAATRRNKQNIKKKKQERTWVKDKHTEPPCARSNLLSLSTNLLHSIIYDPAFGEPTECVTSVSEMYVQTPDPHDNC